SAALPRRFSIKPFLRPQGVFPNCGWKRGNFRLEVLIKITFRTNPLAHAQDMRRQTSWCQFHVIPCSLPQKSPIGEKIMSLECVIRVESQRTQVQIHPAGLFVKKIEIHNDDNYIGKIISRLAEAQQKWIVRFVKSKPAVALQCRIVLADTIHSCDEVPQASVR